MKYYSIVTREIILKQNKQDSGIETFVYEPSTVAEELLGNLYIIGRLRNPKSELEFVPNLVASAIKREFYKTDSKDANTHFELALKRANTIFSDLVKSHSNITQDINFCALNIIGDTVRFAKIGSISTFLFRDGEVIDMSKKHIGKNRKELFSSIVSGNVLERDKFIIGTEKTPFSAPQRSPTA